jgi:tryptophan 7-halogenase
MTAQSQAIRNVVIAGGGTAGWLVAAALVRQLGALLSITLVESEEIGTVGVGESTIPTARSFHEMNGVDERAFMRATGSSFKLGISFENWGRLGDRYIHSFGQIGTTNWMGDFHHFWLQAKAAGHGGDLGEYCLEHQAAAAHRFETGPDARLNYAYHLDAGAYARFLRTLSEAHGVNQVEGKIATVALDAENGDIAALVLNDGRRIEGDLFIDCTGFRGLLIEQALKTGYEDWQHWLPTNSALAVQTAATEPAAPYTRAIAHDAGWRWKIPLQHRVGNGLVYCSDHLSDDMAHDRLLAEISGEMLIEPRLIRYQTGMRRKSWNRNCVAFGLSGGFVEPLESTSIHLIMIGVTRLIQMFPFSGVTPALVDRYNAMSRIELERIRDFIILHYHQTERDDSPFWTRMRTNDVPDTLKQRMALFAESAHAYQAPDELFRVDSWVQVMLGQRLRPRGYHHLGRLISDDKLRQGLKSMSAEIATVVSNLPDHQKFLDGYCPAAVA